ncbi:MAG: S8 family serine peptidase [Planctomycetota bacterium]
MFIRNLLGSCALLLVTGPLFGQSFSDLQDLRNPPRATRQPAGVRAIPKLLEASDRGRAAGAEELRQAGFRVTDDDFAIVEIVGPLDSAPLSSAVLAAVGGAQTGFFAGRTEARVPIEGLRALAAALPMTHLMEPVGLGLELSLFEGQGTTVMRSLQYRDDGFDGTGIKIGVIDVGYNGLNTSTATGDAPAGYTFYNYTPRSLLSATDGSHGRFVVETVFDHAPGATYVILKVDSQSDVGAAVSDCITEDVDVIVMSLGWWPSWSDDGDTSAVAANTAANAGILFLHSAGNEAKEHYQGNFTDPDGDGYHSWDGGIDEVLAVTIAPGSTASFRLSYDPAGGNHDYDFYMYNSDATQILSASTIDGETDESVNLTNGGMQPILVQLVVERIAGPGTEIEIYSSGGTWLEHAVAAGSTTSPANATHANVLTVGAVPQNLYGSAKYTGGIIADYSSQGPTNDGSFVPDICAPTSTSTSFAATFTGTSCACPNAAGVAACLWSVNPLGTATQVRNLLYQWAAAKDWGAPGADSIYGRGGVNFPTFADCNGNDYPDAFDLASGGSTDANGNGRPDECDPFGYGFGWLAPNFPPIGGFKLIGVVDPSAGTAAPLPPVSGFTMAFGYDPVAITSIAVAPAPGLLDFLGGPPAVFDVTDTGSSIVVQCTFAMDPVTGGPLDLPLTLLTETVECDVMTNAGTGAGSGPLHFEFANSTAMSPPAINGMHTAAGSLLPAITFGAVDVAPTPIIQHMYLVQAVGAEDDTYDFAVPYDPAAPAGSFSALCKVAATVPNPGSIDGLAFSLRHDPALLAATSSQVLDTVAGTTPDFSMVQMSTEGVAIAVQWSTGTTLPSFTGAGLTVATVTYQLQPASLTGDLDGTTTLLEWNDVIGIAGAANTVSSGSTSETPILQAGIVNLVADPQDPLFRRGDVDGNGSATIGDAIVLLGYLFTGGSTPGCLDAADANDDGTVTIADPVFLLAYLFQAGVAPPAPGILACGPDPSADSLDCATRATTCP